MLMSHFPEPFGGRFPSFRVLDNGGSTDFPPYTNQISPFSSDLFFFTPSPHAGSPPLDGRRGEGGRQRGYEADGDVQRFTANRQVQQRKVWRQHMPNF